jgi:hypothetical protein
MMALWAETGKLIMDCKCMFFFSGEGPHSRRYGHTAALRLLVQPCDEDDDDFLSFS